MARNKNWVRADFRALILQVGEFKFRCAQFTSSFALNEIPKATCMLAIGRKTDGSNEQATIHQAAFQLKGMEPAIVKWTPKGEYDEKGHMWPEEERTLFDGYLTGFAYRKVQNKIQAVIHLTHWLTDMAFSSTASRAVSPSSANMLVWKANHQQLGEGSGTQGGTPENMPDRIGSSSVNLVKPDLWSAMKDILCGLASKQFPEVRGPDLRCRGVEKTTNAEAKSALTYIEDSMASECPFKEDLEGNTDKYSVPLRFDPKTPSTFPKKVIEAIGSAGLKQYAQSSFWDVLIGQFAAQYLFSVCPLVSRALVVPFQAGSRPTWKVKLKPHEYAFIDFNAILPRPMQSVSVYGGYHSRTFAPGYENPGGLMPQGMIGCYKPANSPEANRGVAHFIHAPSWLINPLGGTYVGGTTGAKDLKAQPSGTQPEPIAGPPEDPGPNTLRLEYGDMWDAYAQSVYVQESTRGRMGAISGKLRFDIGPGSTVELEQQPEKFIGAEDELAAPLVGHVVRVTVNINSESRDATTSFKLAFVRTIKENQDDRLSVAKHPLYAEAYKGSPLIPEYLFD